MNICDTHRRAIETTKLERGHLLVFNLVPSICISLLGSEIPPGRGALRDRLRGGAERGLHPAAALRDGEAAPARPLRRLPLASPGGGARVVRRAVRAGDRAVRRALGRALSRDDGGGGTLPLRRREGRGHPRHLQPDRRHGHRCGFAAGGKIGARAGQLQMVTVYSTTVYTV